jgi:hypothetical protein
MDGTSLLLDGPGIFISAEGSRKIDYGSCTFHIWAESMVRLDQVRAKLLTIVGEQLVRHEMFRIDLNWSKRFGTTSSSEMPYQVQQKHRRLNSTGGFPSMRRILMM